MRQMLLAIVVVVAGFFGKALGGDIDVGAFGVVGDGAAVNTAAIQKAIDACGAGGGGRVRFPAGKYLTGTIELKDGVVLRLEEGAELVGSAAAEDYRNVDPFIDGSGSEMGWALVAAVGAKNVGIEGAGVIDGRGKDVKAAQIKERGKYNVRPFLVRWVKCSGVKVSGVELRNSGAWGMNFFQCSDAAVDHVKIRSRGLVNNDGIDVDSCENVSIAGCDISSGDDAVCLKATSPKACRDVRVKDCVLSTHCNGIKFGTESLGDFEHVEASGCKMADVDMAGIAMYAVDGSHLHDVRISDISMERVNVPISIRLGARLKTFRAGDDKKPVGEIRDVVIKGLRAIGTKGIGMLINGIPGHAVEDLTFQDIDIEVVGGGTAENATVQLAENEAKYPEWNMFGKTFPAYGIYARHVRGVRFEDVKVHAAKEDGRGAVMLVDAEGVLPEEFGAGATTRSTTGPATRGK